ncbi:endoglucanase 13-like [Aristolochia californica]|uniref:endoglucanase 13-like n=1 Tax=Aristolochia californica TaxID=171875 RepID=UPI0035D87C8F
MDSSFCCCTFFFLLFLQQGFAAFNYGEALTKAILFFEGQRSGKLPAEQRVHWRGDSGLNDGRDSGVNMVGGYYDAGDNVKFGFPMAFTITQLSWGAIEFGARLSAKKELYHVMDAIRWGTDYLMKAHPEPDVLYGEVGDGNSDHACWERPEDMNTPRNAYRIDDRHPGADLAGETAAALAAASVVFQQWDPPYANQLLTHAKQLFNFARIHPGLYQDSIPVVTGFYRSSDFKDELLWAAAWLHRATGDKFYLDFLSNPQGGTGGLRYEFSWNDKYAGAQALVAKLVLEGKVSNEGVWADYKNSVEEFICSCIQKGRNNFRKTPGGLLWWGEWSSLQYISSSMLLVAIYSDYLEVTKPVLKCPGGDVQPSDLISLAQSQVNYILGANPMRKSYMVGFGSNYPRKIHHRAASIVSMKEDPTPVDCKGGYDHWYFRNGDNPNMLVGAIAGGPDANDGYKDDRGNFRQNEPSTSTNSGLIGVLARLA